MLAVYALHKVVYAIRLVMAKMGRPKMQARERRSHLIMLRLTPAEHGKLERLARKSGLSVSDYVRRALGFKSK
jgi:predicted HicB family RNase H-like nuclease